MDRIILVSVAISKSNIQAIQVCKPLYQQGMKKRMTPPTHAPRHSLPNISLKERNQSILYRTKGLHVRVAAPESMIRPSQTRSVQP
jgi:hypothetical protein